MRPLANWRVAFVSLVLNGIWGVVANRTFIVNNHCDEPLWVAAVGSSACNGQVVPILWGTDGDGYLPSGASQTVRCIRRNPQSQIRCLLRARAPAHHPSSAVVLRAHLGPYWL